MDWACAVALEWTPADVDRHSFRDIYYALGAARQRMTARRHDEWQRALIVIDGLYNYAGYRPEGFQGQPLGTTYRTMFDIDLPDADYQTVVNTLMQLGPPDGERI